MRMATSPLFLLLVIGAIVAAIFLRRRPGAMAAVGGLFAAVLVAGSLWRTSYVQTVNRMPSVQAWMPSDEQLANASVYPSAETAARFVGTTLAPKVAMRTTNERIPGIDVSGSAPDPIRAIIAAKIIDTCPHLRLINPRMSAESAQTTRPADHLIVTVNDTEDFSGRGQRMLQATAEVPRIGGSTVGANAYYDNKPWAEKPPGIHQIYPGRQFLVAWSSHNAVSSEEAMEEARRSAAWQMAPMVWQRLEREHSGPQLNSGQLQNQIEMMIANRIIPHDEFVQQMGRNYGNIWRAAIRIDAPDSTAQAVAGNIASQTHAERRLFGSRVASVGALLALIVIVYFLLNAITKGYFSKTLQAGAIISLLIGLLALMLMA